MNAVERVDRIVAAALNLSAIPAPTGREEARAEAFAALLGQIAGVTVWRDSAGSVLGRLPKQASEQVPKRLPGQAHGQVPPLQHRRSQSGAIVVTAHLDTVFGPDIDVRPRRAGETLHGPGIGDNAIALAALLELARALVGAELSRDVILAATVGEEGLGNLRGIRALLGAEPAACVIALEGHRLDRLTTRAVGSVRLGVTYTTPGGHSWEDRGAASAIHALAQAVTPVVEQVRGSLPACAVNVGVIAGGTTVNSIAARAELQLDLRATDPAALAAADALARELFETTAARSGVGVAITDIGRRPAGALPDDHPLVIAAQQARGDAGLAAAPLADGSTDANAAWEAGDGDGVPGISIGITHGRNAHRLDEWIEIAPIAQGFAAALGLIRAAAR